MDTVASGAGSQVRVHRALAPVAQPVRVTCTVRIQIGCTPRKPACDIGRHVRNADTRMK